jgi:hypothetical protein
MNARVGPADYYAPGEWNLVCSICGRKMKSGDAVKNWQGMWRHRRCNNPRQPQDFVRVLPDDQTVPFSQPPTDSYVQISINLPIFVQPQETSTQVLLSENNQALLNENGTALLAEEIIAQVLIPGWIDIQSINWTWQSGGNQINIVSPTEPVTQLTLSGNIVHGDNYSGVLLCTVNSTEGGIGTGTCNISITA